MNFRPSDKVVCVNDKANPPTELMRYVRVDGPLIREGCVYTVDRMIEVEFRLDGLCPRVCLVGHSIIWLPTGDEIGFHPSRFRRLDDIREENRLRMAAEIEEMQPA